jgi:hypothetical protein
MSRGRARASSDNGRTHQSTQVITTASRTQAGARAPNPFQEEMPDLRRLPSADLLVNDCKDSSSGPFSLCRIEIRHVIGDSREKVLLVPRVVTLSGTARLAGRDNEG